MVNIEVLRGEASRSAKITEKTAQAILDAKGRMTSKECVALYSADGATPSIVTGIWRRRRWTHLKRTDRGEG